LVKSMKSLKDLKQGDCCVIDVIPENNSMRRRLLDIGLVENTRVECVGQSPSGDPKAFLIRGAVIALRLSDCAMIPLKEDLYGTD